MSYRNAAFGPALSSAQGKAMALRLLIIVAGLALALLVGQARAQSVTTVEVYAEGLVNPKGMAFTPDGTLYVAESGRPGEVMVPLPVNFGGEGPIGTNGRVSRVRPGGEREDFVTGLPNIGLYSGVEMLGAGSVAALDDQLYEVAAGHMTVSPTLSRVAADGSMEAVADVGRFNLDNPPPPSNGDAVPMGNPYDLVALGGDLYITDGNFNRIIKATTGGSLSLLAQWENSPVTVGAAAGLDGNLYVTQFSPAPYNPGTGRIDRVSPNGAVEEGVAHNLTTPIDVAFAPDGTMYVLQYAAEFSPERLRYIAFGGEVRRVLADGSTEAVVTNLVFPTAMTFGPDGALYVANYGNEANEGQGHVLRVVPGDQPARAPDAPPPDESGSYAVVQPTAVPPDLAGAPVVATINIVEPSDPMQWGYDPPELRIQTSQAVTFINTGRIPHTATQNEGAFDTGLLRGGESATLRFDTPGTFAYFCQPHPWMQGSIIVEGEPTVTTPGSTGAEDDESLSPPTISPWLAAIFVGGIIIGVFAIAYAMRRRPRQAEAAGGSGNPEVRP
ncbi:MAG: ScyD/ScyE family protein [Chloroflexi bacterium]|nr:ScyD/ScyE family protein [Chloroflexota bacterium]